MFEPIIKTDLTHLPKTIDTNLSELEPFISDHIEQAKSLVVNCDSIPDCEKAEADAALLTKLSKRITEFRLTWTKQWQAPFEGVISKCKDYERRLAEAGDDLRKKAKVGRDKIRTAKKDELWDLWLKEWSDVFGNESAGYRDRFFAEMCSEKTKGCWTNRGKTINKCLEEMRLEINRCAEAMNTIRTMFANDSDAIKDVAEHALEEHFAIDEAIVAVNNYRAQQERIAKREAEAQAKREAEAKDVAPAPAPAPTPTERTLVEDEPMISYVLKVTGTRTNLFALRDFCNAHGITVTKINN